MRGFATRMALLATALVTFVLVLNAGQALATHVGCGYTITQDTTLDSDLLDCAGDGIVIGAGNIILDLNGHTVDGTHGRELQGVDNGEGHDAFELRGPGTIRDFDAGVLLFNASDNLVHRIEASANTDGIYLDGPIAARNVIERNVVTANFFEGIKIADYCSANVAAGDNRVQRNTAFRNGDNGIILSGCGDGNVISHNRTFENYRGIFLSDSFGETVIEKNDVFRNLGPGIGSIELQNARIDKNRVTGNGADGITIDDHNNLIKGNTTNGNADDGIEVPADNTVSRNTANRNGDLGIEAYPGVSDGGGNRAFGNGNPLQCLNVACK